MAKSPRPTEAPNATVRISISLAGKRSLQGIYVAAGSSVARATVRIDLI